MTNYDNLEPGPELDALVAERVMGWTLRSYYTNLDAASAEDYEDAATNDGWVWVGRPGKHEAWEWQPSRDIACAWEVVERIASDGFDVSIGWSPGDREWFSCAGLDGLGWDIVSSDCAEQAICIAALKLADSLDGVTRFMRHIGEYKDKATTDETARLKGELCKALDLLERIQKWYHKHSIIPMHELIGMDITEPLVTLLCENDDQYLRDNIDFWESVNKPTPPEIDARYNRLLDLEYDEETEE